MEQAMTGKTELAARAEQVGQAAEGAMHWVLDRANADLVGLEARDLAQMLRRNARRARRLSLAAENKMAVSVFGPSQAGKSFLVSVLARPQDGKLVADYGSHEGQLDYISQINPEGEGESTGVVTRFTMSRPACPAGFPVTLRLLGEADVIRILINSFFMDGDENAETPPRSEDIDALFSRLASKRSDPIAGLDEDDLWDVRDYVEQNFRSRAYAAALQGYWAEAAALAPRLSVADRGQLFSVLWGSHAPLTALYTKLASARQGLGAASVVHVGLDALVPRETSIIDVKTLRDLTSSDDATLMLALGDGQRKTIPRALLCALTAELVLPMRERPWDMFEHTDLLDFPGTRNRFKDPLAVTLREPEKNIPELLLRGKVAYLFDRYVADQEITAMLLCIPDSNMEAIDLPRLVEDWISLTHGATPEDRLQADCILFFVLTKFDKHLGESAADGGAATRFQRRMEASFEKFWRHAESWPRQWTSDQPFRNCFWLRNPNFYVPGLIEYDEAKREIGIVQSQRSRLQDLRDGFLNAEAVQTHFAEPAAAWDAAMALNDGGISYMVEALLGVCRPEVKLRQIETQLQIEIREIASRIDRFYIASDVETRLAEKRAAADQIIDALEAVLLRHSFGALHRALTVSGDAITDRIVRVPQNTVISAAAGRGADVGSSPAAAAPSARVRPGRGSPATPQTSASEGGTTLEPEVRILTREAFQAETALEVWLAAMRRFAEDPQLERRYGMSAETAQTFVSEIAHAARRRGLRTRMVDMLKQAAANFAFSGQQQAAPASIICAEIINRFVEDFDARRLPDAERPQVVAADGTSSLAFADRKAVFDASEVPHEPLPYADRRWTDWTHALFSMFEANALDMDGTKMDIEQNMKLGELLTELRNAKGAA
jgi:hypothetical protein